MRGQKSEKTIGISAGFGPLGAVDPLAAVLAEKDLHDPVLERMKCDHSKSGTGFEARGNLDQRPAEGSEFIIHMHAQSLKNPRGRMTRTAARDDFANRIGELQRGFKWTSLANSHQVHGDLLSPGLFAILKKDFGQLGGLHSIDYLGGCPWNSRPHSHIEGTFLLERKSAFSGIQMTRGNSQIQHRSI